MICFETIRSFPDFSSCQKEISTGWQCLFYSQNVLSKVKGKSFLMKNLREFQFSDKYQYEPSLMIFLFFSLADWHTEHQCVKLFEEKDMGDIFNVQCEIKWTELKAIISSMRNQKNSAFIFSREWINNSQSKLRRANLLLRLFEIERTSLKSKGTICYWI